MWLRSHQPIVIGEPINKKVVKMPLTVVIGNSINKEEVIIPLTGCHWISIITFFFLIGYPMITDK
jgi:hypothetical protein